MKHKAKSFIAVLLALCLMMSLGVGALAVDESDGFDTPGGETIGPDIDILSGDNPGGVEGSNPPEPRVGEEYNINIAEGIVGGNVTVTVNGVELSGSSVKAKSGDNVIVTVTPETGYVLEHVVIFQPEGGTLYYEVKGDKYTFDMPASDVEISAEFKSTDDEGTGGKYKIIIDDNIVGGTVTVEDDKTEAAEGETVYIIATPGKGYTLLGLQILEGYDGTIENDGDGKYHFSMPANEVKIGALFQATGDEGGETTGEHSITANVTPSEGGTVELSQTTADEGDEVTFTVKPNPGYEMDGNLRISGLGSTIDDKGDGSYTFTMEDEDVTISVAFKQVTYAINVDSAIANGKVSTAPAARAAAGTTVTLSAEPDTGYELVGYTVTKDGGGAVTVTNGQFTMPDSAVTVSATFKKVEIPEPPVVETTHDVHIVNSEGGIVNANPGEAVKDTTIKLTSGSDYRHYFVGYKVWTESGKTVTVSNDSFTMPDEDVYVKGIFKLYQPTLDWHSIDVDKPYYSSVTVDSWAYETETVTFTVDTWYDYDYYSVSVWTDGGAKVSLSSLGNDKYSFTMPDDDVTIYVDYSYVGRYSITKDVEGDGSIYVRSSADHGDTVWIEAAPNAGQSLTSLRVFYGEPWAYGDKGYYGYWDEAEVKYSTYWDAYYFTMPADDVVVYARFTDGATVDVITGDHGDAKVSSRYADKGDWVYITAYPDEGYEVDSVTVTDSLGRSVKVTELSYDYFLFTMPGTSVDVKVTFRAKDYDVFYDVSRGDWYYKAVRFVHEKGIMEGTGTHYFSPEADLSRGMLATILYRLEGSPAVSGYSGFTDVADTAYYAKAVAWAKANGIVNGVTATAYEPDTAVTREELAAILCRYAAFKGKDTAISYDYLAGFSDANTSHVYARPALNWAVAYDIINGQGNGVLAPRATATRAEVAQVLMNYLEVFD